MKRLPLTFQCDGTMLAGTLDTGPLTTGLLYVSGGNEIRSGAFAGQAALAARIAKAGFPVFRFDRRGVGDSDGENLGFRQSQRDIESALEAFRAIAPQITKVVGFGNCDAASALMLAGGAGCDQLILSNPWTIEGDESQEHAPAAVRSRYLSKLKQPGEIKRLLTGGVNLSKLAKGIGQASKTSSSCNALSQEMADGIAGFPGTIQFLIATADRTAQIFESNWDKTDPRIARCTGATHAYVETESMAWLEKQLLAALRR